MSQPHESMRAQQPFDATIIGGGIVGLATAYALSQKKPQWRLAVLEKEPALAQQQSGHNSGVIHSGIYYAPGSLKARTCREGKQLLEAFCEAEGLPWQRCGKVIVATHPRELPRLDALLARGQANGVACERIDAARLREVEPHAAGLAAIHVPDAGIVDYPAVCRRLAERLQQAGHPVRCGCTVHGLVPGSVHASAVPLRLRTSHGEVATQRVVNTAGLHADAVAARLTGRWPSTRIVPFRGEYYALVPEAAAWCRALIYPVPDPRFPFLGVHLTRMIGGGVECGPNAVLALAREGYAKGRVDWRDACRIATTPGVPRLLARHWRTGLGEMWRSWSKRAFARAVRRLVPAIEPRHLLLAPAGVRAQAVERGGRLVDDFRVEVHGRTVHVLNAPSPAATASFAVGRVVAALCVATTT